LGIVSWAIVATPFIILSVATAISMGLDLDYIITNTATEHLTQCQKQSTESL
jgi:hypothetical protein